MSGHVDASLARARAAGVTGFLLAGVDPEGWAVERAIAAQHSDVFVSIGVHPQVVLDISAHAMVDAITLEGAVAIGEIGLDAMTPERRALLPLQTEIFRRQLAIARDADLPVILHVLRAHEDALSILKKDALPKAGGVVHSYSGSADLLARYLALGLHISLAGAVSWKNAVKAPQVAAVVPKHRLLVETDAPDQTPEPHRPKSNEPAFLPAVVAAIARCRNETIDEVGRFTEENARKLFRL